MSGMVPNSCRGEPDARGYYGPYGGRFVAETLATPVLELERAWRAAREDPDFQARIREFARDYTGRPSPLYHAERLSRHLGGPKVYFKRDELNHTGSHKINNCIGQALLAMRMGKTRLVAETGAGQHGVATATIAARLGLRCVVYMGARDIVRQKPNVFRMRLLGAEVRSVGPESATLTDALNEALRDWAANVHDTFYVIGTAAGPHPYPWMVQELQSVIGEEARAQILGREHRLPDALIACIGGGSNAIGLFHPFLDDPSVRFYGVEAAGSGPGRGQHAASLACGSPGVLHGNRTSVLQDENGQILGTHSVSAGLDYPGVSPLHAWLRDSGRLSCVSATDAEALGAFHLCARTEGILPALEPAHALAFLVKLASGPGREELVIVNICGRGDKDVHTVAAAAGDDS